MSWECVEICPHCGNENIYPDYDPVKNDYKAICNHCEKEIFLCDECLHSEDNEVMRCDWNNGKCWRGEIKEDIV